MHEALIGLSVPEKIYATILETATGYVSQFHGNVPVFGNLYVKRSKKPFLEVKAFVGPKSIEFSPIQHVGIGIVGHVAVTGEGIIIPNTNDPPENLEYRPFIEGMNGGSEISIPLKVANEVNSVINLESPVPNLFGKRDLELLTTLANEISVGVKFAQLYEELYLKQQQKFHKHEHKYLRVVSHEITRSANDTFQELPIIEEAVKNDPLGVAALSRVRECVSQALSAEKRLLPFSTWPVFERIDLLEIITKVVDARRENTGRIRFETTNIQRPSFYVNGNETFMGFVFENLIRNSIDAMGGDGVISIIERPTGFPDKLTLFFSDTGKGVRPEVRSKIFEPMFSDDGSGHAKGLGLDYSLFAILSSACRGRLIWCRRHRVRAPHSY